MRIERKWYETEVGSGVLALGERRIDGFDPVEHVAKVLG